MESLCYIPGTNIALLVNYTSKQTDKQRNKLSENEIRFVLTTGRVAGRDEGSQKVQTSSFMINKYRDVVYHRINIINTAVCYI